MLGKILRIVAIILMGLTSALMFLGGIGTICIAFWPEKYESLAVMVPYKPIYQVAAILTIAGGLLGVWVTIKLRHFDKRAFLYAVLILLLSLATAGVKMYFSNKARGSVAPTNMRFYLTLFTLAYFLVMRIPGIWEKVKSGPRQGNGADAGAGVAAIIAGALTLTVQFWAGPTHTFGGVNYADVWHVQLAIVGWALILLGLIPLARAVIAAARKEKQQAALADARSLQIAA
jgi:cytochrome bd-type quinol oxidase subunit 2